MISQTTGDFGQCPRGTRGRRQEITRSRQSSPVHVTLTTTTTTDLSPYQPTLKLSPFLSSSEASFFMHIFSTETAIRLFPAAPAIFLQRMISSALETPHLLYALLAAASSHHGRLVRDQTPKSRINCLQFTSSAMSSLRTSLSRTKGVPNAEAVATAMVLCTNDVCNGDMNAWRTHLGGVMRLLVSFLGRYEETPKADNRDRYVRCLVKWFTTMNVLAASSGIAETCPPDAQDMLLRATSSASNLGHVDAVCGYSLELVPLLSQITRLACLRKVRETDPSTMLLEGGEEWLERVMPTIMFLEKQVSALAGKNASPTCTVSDNELITELEHTNNAFVYSALLHLHRRVQMLPRDHPKVRGDVTGIIRAMKHIRPLSPANILILWPVFSVGCETEDADERAFIQNRMGDMQQLGMGNFTRARELLRDYWASDTTIQWDVYFERQGVELVLF